MNKNDYIAVFDSGVGGISVLRELLALMPNERYLYFGDSANAPYGTRPTSEVRDLTMAAAEMLMARGCKALVVACNTATAAAIIDLRAKYPDTVKDLLYCMMVASGNDAAIILADHVLGSQKAFVAEMNRYVTELGCANTHFTNVHGLHDDKQYTTARDMAKILAKAIQNTLFCEVFGAKEYAMPQTNKSNARRLISQNYLLKRVT